MKQIVRGLTIYYCGKETCEPKHFFGPAIRQHYLLHIVLEGKGQYLAGDHQFQVKKGEGFLIRPEEVTYYEADETEPWEYAWAAFGGMEGERLLQEYGLTDDHYLCSFGGGSQWAVWILKLVAAFEERGDNQNEMAGYLYLLFSKMSPYKDTETNYMRGYMIKAEAYIHNNYSYPIRISDIAGYVGVERTYLYKIFMKYKQTSPKKYLTVYRIMAARGLLEHTNLSVTEIGLSCGFNDSSMFCRKFQELTEISPLQYRKKFVREGVTMYKLVKI